MGHNAMVRHLLDDPAWHSLVGPLARFAPDPAVMFTFDPTAIEDGRLAG